MRSLLLLLLLSTMLALPACRTKHSRTVVPEESPTARLTRDMAGLRPPGDQPVENLPLLLAHELVEEYQRNPLKADSKYHAKWLRARGRLVAGPTKQTLQDAEFYALGIESKNKILPCIFFGSDKKDSLAGLVHGQMLTVTGGYYSTDNGVVLAPCLMPQPYESQQ